MTHLNLIVYGVVSAIDWLVRLSVAKQCMYPVHKLDPVPSIVKQGFNKLSLARGHLTATFTHEHGVLMYLRDDLATRPVNQGAF